MTDISPALAMEIEKLVASSSPEQRLIADEQSHGFAVIRPGEAPWLPASDWLPMTMASTDGRRVRLVVLAAIRPGHGALLRLVIEIVVAQLEPVIVEPSDRMSETLRRWGWKPRRIGKGFAAQQIWYPRRRGK